MSEDREPSAEIVAAFGQVMIVRHDADRMVVLLPRADDDVPDDGSDTATPPSMS